LEPWLVMRKPSYYHSFQRAGMIFGRDNAFETTNRSYIIKNLEKSFNDCKVEKNKNGNCFIDIPLIRKTCNFSSGKLSYIVFDEKIEGKVLSLWTVPSGYKGDKTHTYYLYQCKDFQ
ncbi:MAG TPA: hypothetical protein VIY47_09920, partial [Ignavibacteriaceae bacterium]